jgi:F-type H+-transporting ATPase subunit delta
MEAIVTPGTLTSLTGRYAKALFDLSMDQGQGDTVGKGLKALEKQIQSTELAQVLADPTIQRHQQAAILQVLQSFVVQLAKARRLALLPKVGEIYHSLTLQAKGEQRVEIISAHTLTPSQQRFLKGKLTASLPGKLAISFVKNPRVLGGIMVRIGSRIIDASLATHLHQLATAMKGATG